jgi:hypothetical protein
MVWLALVLFAATAIAVIRGGRLRNLSDIRLRYWWLLILGFGMQAATEFFPTEADWARPTGVTLVLLSYLPLIIMVIANRAKPGMWLAGLGILMNFTVIAANGGMPVLEGAAIVAGGFPDSVDIAGNYKHLVLDEGSRFALLADVIPLRFLGQGQVISLGDVFLAIGLGRFLEHELRRPVRWFKHGARAEAGSARRR